MSVKVLVADDEVHFERLVKQRFRKQISSGTLELFFANDGIQALEIINQHPEIDVILSDINMPRMDGLTLLAEHNKLDHDAKVVMVSAYGDMKNIRKAMNNGAFDFVEKPINFEDLEATVQKARREVLLLREGKVAKQELHKIQQELAAAKEIQQSIVPKDFSSIPLNGQYQLHATMLPAREVGGDFYDFFMIDKDHLAVVVGDVSGKGMPAALFMAITRTLLRATSLKSKDMKACLEQVNTLLCQDNGAQLFVTLFYGILHLPSGELTYSSCGHEPPWLTDTNGGIEALEGSQHVPLGITEGTSFKPATVLLQPGMNLVVYTDGVTEALNEADEFFSEERFADFVKGHAQISPEGMVQAITRGVQSFAGARAQSDDLTALVLHRV